MIRRPYDRVRQKGAGQGSRQYHVCTSWCTYNRTAIAKMPKSSPSRSSDSSMSSGQLKPPANGMRFKDDGVTWKVLGVPALPRLRSDPTTCSMTIACCLYDTHNSERGSDTKSQRSRVCATETEWQALGAREARRASRPRNVQRDRFSHRKAPAGREHGNTERIHGCVSARMRHLRRMASKPDSLYRNQITGWGRLDGRKVLVTADDFSVRGGHADGGIQGKAAFAEVRVRSLRCTNGH